MNTFKYGNKTFAWDYTHDDCHETPWEWADGHGPVSEWTRRDKHPGELVLCEDHGSKRYYDFKAAMEMAKADGWNAWPYKVEGETAGQRAYKAVMADYEYLRQWCNDEWSYIVLHVVLLDEDGDETEYEDYLGGIEYGWYIDQQAKKRGDEPYYEECLREMAENVLQQWHADHEWEIRQNLGVAA